MSPRNRRWSVASLVAVAVASVATHPLASQNVTQAGTAAAGTLQLNNVAPAARDAFFAAMDAAHRWAFMDAHEQATRALAADSTFGLARVYRMSLGPAATVAATNAQYQRAIADAATRPAPEQTLLLAERFTGENANRLYAAARQAYPSDRNVALEQALALAGRPRIDSLRSLVTQYPDLLGARLWLAFYLSNGFYTPSHADYYDALIVAQKAAQLAPTAAGSHTALAHVLHYMGRDDEAAMHLAAATKMDRRAEYAYILEAEIFLADGKPQRVERARAALDSAMAASPNPARRSTDRLYKALALFYDGRATEGMAEAAAVARDDEAAGALGAAATKYSQLAELAGGIGDSADVDKWLGEARRVSSSTNVGIQSVQALALGHQPAAARRALDDGMRGTDTTTANAQADLHRLRGMILLADGKPAEALAELKRGDPRQNTFSELAMIDAYTALKDQKNADATRAALLARPGISAVSLALAGYRAQKKK